MKTFFSLTGNIESPYKKYTSKSLDGEEHDNIVELDEQIDKFDSELSGFTILKYASYFGFAIGAIILLGRLIGKQNLFGDGLELTVISLIFMVLGVCFLITSYIVVYNIKHNNKRKELIDKQNELMNQYYYQLGAIDPMVDIDVYMPEVTIDESGKEETANPMFHTCLNLPVKVFVDESKDEIGMIYLLNLIKLPKSSIINIEKVNKRLHINSWNKSVPMKSKEFKEYSIKTDSYGIYIKGYYRVTMKLDDEDYQFIVAGYDINKFIELLKIE